LADLLCVAGQRNARDYGCETLIAGKVAEAVGPIRNDPAIDLLFTGIRLPSDGEGELILARARRLRPRVLVFYARGTLTDILSRSEFFSKPYVSIRAHRAPSGMLNELEEIDSCKPCANSESGSEQAAPDNWLATRYAAKL
jgi:hypothetical protein